MTREEKQKVIDAVERLNALKQFIGYDKDSEIVQTTQKSIDMAIKALEQEPMLDKIRAEIKEVQTYKMFEGEDTVYVERKDVLAIIDKYKVESEG